MQASISVQIGDGFHFKFENKDDTENAVKKKSPSQEKRDRERSRKHNDDKNEKIVDIKEEHVDAIDEIEVKLSSEKPPVESESEIDLCEKVFIIPKYKKEKKSEDIEKEIISKLVEKGVEIRRIFIERDGHPHFGKYNRSIVLIEPFDRKIIKTEDFKIENFWVLTDR